MTHTFGNEQKYHSKIDYEHDKNMAIVSYWEGNERLFENYVFNESKALMELNDIEMAKNFITKRLATVRIRVVASGCMAAS